MDFIDSKLSIDLCRHLHFVLEDLKQLESLCLSNTAHMAVCKMQMNIYDTLQKLTIFEVKK